MRKRARPIASDPALIVVADADGAAARLLATHLTSRGLKAVHVGAGRKVLSLARSGGLALAILDVRLKDMSGHALASQLKGIDSKIPILMTSADHRPELEMQARQVGIIFYAHKPINHVLVEAVVTKTMRHAGAPANAQPARRARPRR